MTEPYRQFSLLCEKRDLAAYRAVAALQLVIDFLEAQDYDGMYVDLRKVLDEFEEIDRRITEFRKQFEIVKKEKPAMTTMLVSNEAFNEAAFDVGKVPLPPLQPLPTPNTPAAVPMKCGIYGPQGAGKSTSAALMAAAISAQFYSRAPSLWSIPRPPGSF